MKNYFFQEEIDNIKLMIESSDEDYILALNILCFIEGEFKDVTKLLKYAFDLYPMKFYNHITSAFNLNNL